MEMLNICYLSIQRMVFLCSVFFTQLIFANPYWNQNKIPIDTDNSVSNFSFLSSQLQKITFTPVNNDDAIDVLRVSVNWHQTDESYTLNNAVIEPSGTEALLARSKHKPKWGSFLGVLVDNETGESVYFDSVGTGSAYRLLAPTMSFRFPIPTKDMLFQLFVENPQTGLMERVLSEPIVPLTLERQLQKFNAVEIQEIAKATTKDFLKVNIYAEGYLESEKEDFWKAALKTVTALKEKNYPGVESMSFYAIFHPSNKKLSEPKNLGKPVPLYDTFLGLYYPYWGFEEGRWYNVVYPTQEEHFRKALAVKAYDLPLVLTNHSGYWGVGNYMALTGIPAANSRYFTYLLFHEFGHLFGLQEEYDDGGTELEFAPGTTELWSPNVTFQAENYQSLKWNAFVSSETPVPTPNYFWSDTFSNYGAYLGGYGGARSAYKPGQHCMMDRYAELCDVCKNAIKEVINYWVGN